MPFGFNRPMPQMGAGFGMPRMEQQQGPPSDQMMPPSAMGNAFGRMMGPAGAGMGAVMGPKPPMPAPPMGIGPRNPQMMQQQMGQKQPMGQQFGRGRR